MPTKAGHLARAHAPLQSPLQPAGPGPAMSTLEEKLAQTNSSLDAVTNSSTHPPSHLSLFGLVSILYPRSSLLFGPLSVPLSGERAERLTVPLYVYSKYASKMVRQNT